MSKPLYDVVVFGATSFVGQILCRYLLERHGSHGSLKWAMAGRSIDKLQAVRAGLGAEAGELPLITADASDAKALRAMCADTKVVVSTVGPYALYGSLLVELCAETGTDYCDLTGEVQWIRRMLDAHEETAKRSGARIVHCCGFDSIPSDLGMHLVQAEARRRFGEPATRVKMRVKAARGAFSGGTVASLMNVAREAAADPKLRKALANPYLLCPDGHANVRQHSVGGGEYDRDFSAWSAPFIMAGINTRVVHRSNALSGRAYGVDLRYDEAMLTGDGLAGRARALAVSGGLGAFLAAAALPPSRWLLESFVVPKPGEGPSPEDQESGFYDIRFMGETDAGETVWVKVYGDRDPGYGSTARMLGEAAACLAQDVDTVKGGFWTPATIFGDKLLARLRAHAGLRFDVVDEPTG